MIIYFLNAPFQVGKIAHDLKKCGETCFIKQCSLENIYFTGFSYFVKQRQRRDMCDVSLTELLIEYGVGVSVVNEYKVKRVDMDYFTDDM